jgi:hypothetical protein
MKYTIVDADGLDIALASSLADVQRFARAYGGYVMFLSDSVAQVTSSNA